MEIRGKIIEILPEKTGTSDKGEWRKQEYILETGGQYPKKICFMIWNDKIEQSNIKQGEDIIASVDIESREYNGRWYTDIKAWRVIKTLEAANQENSDAKNILKSSLSSTESPLDGDDIIPF